MGCLLAVSETSLVHKIALVLIWRGLFNTRRVRVPIALAIGEKLRPRYTSSDLLRPVFQFQFPFQDRLDPFRDLRILFSELATPNSELINCFPDS